MPSFRTLAAASALALPWICGAGEVDLRTANFSADFQDIRYPGEGIPVAIRRIYNSRSDYTGYFGTGWSSNLETRLTFYPDGSAVVQEWGGGARNHFEASSPPPAAVANLLKKCIDDLVTNAQQKMRVSGPTVAEYRKRLAEDAEFRRAEWETALSAHEIQGAAIPAGSKWVSQEFGRDFLQKTAGGFTRTRSDRIQELFDSSGKLVRTEDPNHNFVRYSYDTAGHLTEIADNFSRSFKITWNGSRIGAIASIGNQHVEYRYSPGGDLTEARPSRGFATHYRYDGSHRSLLTRITSTAGTEDIAYSGREQNEAPRTHVDLLGRTEQFQYTWKGPVIELAAKKVVAAGKTVQDYQVSYQYVTTDRGEQVLKKKVETIDGERIAIDYDSASREPAKIVSKEGTYERTYSPQGALLRRKTPQGSIEFTRSPSGTLTRLTQFDTSGKPLRDIHYQYNPAGNLVGVSSGASSWHFVRDASGRIKILADASSKRYELSYDEHSVVRDIASGVTHLHVVYRGIDQPLAVRGVSSQDKDQVVLPLIQSIRAAQESAPEANFGALIEQLESISQLKAV